MKPQEPVIKQLDVVSKPEALRPAWESDATLESLVEETLSKKETKMHTHSYSGDRLWNDEKCPICRIKAQPVVFESKDVKVAKEKFHDKMLLTLSLDLDRELIRKAMDVEAKRHNTAIENSKYNYSKFVEKTQEQKSEQKNHPMGNLFENRELPPDKAPIQKELADYLHGQIVQKQEKAQNEKMEKEIEEMQNQARFSKDLKTMEITVQLEKWKKWKKQREALAEQIEAKNKLADLEKNESQAYDNPHARSESLMVLYKKEKAKQLYQEQLILMKQKKEFESKVAEIDNQHSLERLVLARKALERDLKEIKISKYQQRKSLELYWKQQIGIKKNAW